MHKGQARVERYFNRKKKVSRYCYYPTVRIIVILSIVTFKPDRDRESFHGRKPFSASLLPFPNPFCPHVSLVFSLPLPSFLSTKTDALSKRTRLSFSFFFFLSLFFGDFFAFVRRIPVVPARACDRPMVSLSVDISFVRLITTAEKTRKDEKIVRARALDSLSDSRGGKRYAM